MAQWRAPHLAQNVDFGIVAAADHVHACAPARNRVGQLRLLSAGDSTFKIRSRSEDREGVRTQRFRFSRETVMARCTIFTVAIPGWADDVKERGIDEFDSGLDMLT